MAKYILFDTETTGTQENDRIIQIAAMIVHGKEKIEIFDTLCSTETAIAIEAMEVHHITPDVIENQPPYAQSEVAQKLSELNDKENYLIAHNISFDLGMLKKEGFESHYTTIDTLRCAKHLLPEMPSHRLQYLRYALALYKVELAEADKLNVTIIAHDALGDVLVMKLLLSKLVLLVKEQFPSVNIMEKLAELTQTPVLLTLFNFGKHKGKRIADVSNTDASYMKWMRNNMELDEDLQFTLDYYLNI